MEEGVDSVDSHEGMFTHWNWLPFLILLCPPPPWSVSTRENYCYASACLAVWGLVTRDTCSNRPPIHTKPKQEHAAVRYQEKSRWLVHLELANHHEERSVDRNNFLTLDQLRDM